MNAIKKIYNIFQNNEIFSCNRGKTKDYIEYAFIFLFVWHTTVFTLESKFIDGILLPKWLSFYSFIAIGLIFKFLILKEKVWLTYKDTILFCIAILFIISPTNTLLSDICQVLSLCGLYLLCRTNINTKALNISITIIGVYILCICYSQHISGLPVKGTFDTPAGASFCISTMTTILLSSIKKNQDIKIRLLTTILIVASIAMLLLMQSRTGVIAVIMVLILMFKTTKIRFFLFSVGLVLLISISFIKFDSTKGRSFIASTSISMFDTPKNILLGRGSQGFQENYMTYQAKALNEKDSKFSELADNIKHPLNEFILLFVNYGIIRSFILLCMILYLLLKNSKDKERPMLLAVLFVFCLFSYPFKYPLAWIILISALGLNAGQGKEIISIKYAPMIGVCLLAISIFLYDINSKWKQAWTLCETGDFVESINKFNECARYIHSSEFIYNHAYALSCTNQHKEAIRIIEKSKCHDYETELLKGYLYHEDKRYERAITHYKIASEMCPNRFKPLYGIFQSYDETESCKDKRQIAQIILNKKIKVHSPEIDWMKQDVKQFLEK